ncbi:MAG: Para-nitrobenzyl esterase [bacterium ADurb.Bin236]|nr:MAG: Para-nitrobenzyl esterase [bacterium ADurb.Bin236]HOY63311.1 carboxylesterase/lipase family protein [bacterium]HPN93215.1 carboxylesterase/lipase family protein [bacterium]
MKTSFKRIVSTAASVATALLFGAYSGAFAQDCSNIKTENGLVSGKLDSGVCSFKGIPYAAPPVGDLRFALPVKAEPWEGTLEALNYGNDCVQHPLSLFPSDKISGSEDCLYLNVWSQAKASDSKLKPVMFFIHGGGFLNGSGAWPIYDGTTLSSRGDVVVVTINYRLGNFGFFAHPSFRRDDGGVGNYGLYDMVAALEWTRDNIKAFGGDPDNVTIFGESAGGISVGLIMISPKAHGLFHKAIIESGPVHYFSSPAKKMEETGLEAAAKLGCPDAASAPQCLRSISAEALMLGAPGTLSLLSSYETSGKYVYAPVIDGVFIPDTPAEMFKRGDFASNIPVIIGSNTDEGSFFTASKKLDTVEQYNETVVSDSKALADIFDIKVDFDGILNIFPASEYPTPKLAYSGMLRDVAFTCPARALSKQMIKKQPKVYLYLFGKAPDEVGPLKDWGAFHGSELAFVFHNFEFMGIKFKSKDNTATSKRILAYWSRFAHTGDPNLQGLPQWELFDPAQLNYMYLDVESEMRSGYRKPVCDYLDQVLFEK